MNIEDVVVGLNLDVENIEKKHDEYRKIGKKICKMESDIDKKYAEQLRNILRDILDRFDTKIGINKMEEVYLMNKTGTYPSNIEMGSWCDNEDNYYYYFFIGEFERGEKDWEIYVSLHDQHDYLDTIDWNIGDMNAYQCIDIINYLFKIDDINVLFTDQAFKTMNESKVKTFNQYHRHQRNLHPF